MAHNRTPVPDQAVGDILLTFVRLPVPGEVKTRLAKRIGPVPASELYRAMAEWVLARTKPPAPGIWRRWACFSPRAALIAITTWLKNHGIDHHLPQAPGDLGVRLMAATGAAFHAKASRVAVIGTDCLEIDQAVIEATFAALDDHDIAIVPAQDGGYTLLGLRSYQPKLFQRIPWSTDQVLAATLSRAKELRLRVHTFPPMHDIDRPDDLMHLPPAFLERHPEFMPDRLKTV